MKAEILNFAAIDPYVETHIPSPKEVVLRGKDMVQWGEGNAYPDYLLELSRSCSTLGSIIAGTTDYIVGDEQTIRPLVDSYAPGQMNTKGDTIRSQVEALAKDWGIYGGFALQVIRSASGAVVEVYYCDIRHLRSNKNNSVFYYSEKWAQGKKDAVVYPAFMPIDPARWKELTPDEKARSLSSILLVKRPGSEVYPVPIFGPAVKACETERCIDSYHLNSINNGFAPSAVINFNNGLPTDEQKEEIEKDVTEKFTGHQNAGRVMLSWNNGKDNATTIETLKSEDFGDKYTALAKHTRQQIFTAFRANPNLFGIPTENLGFSQEEYESAFKLYNRTAVRPVQDKICEAYERIYGQPGVLTITPFTLDTQGERRVS